MKVLGNYHIYYYTPLIMLLILFSFCIISKYSKCIIIPCTFMFLFQTQCLYIFSQSYLLFLNCDQVKLIYSKLHNDTLCNFTSHILLYSVWNVFSSHFLLLFSYFRSLSMGQSFQYNRVFDSENILFLRKIKAFCLHSWLKSFILYTYFKCTIWNYLKL
jgi:hypothetical protein